MTAMASMPCLIRSVLGMGDCGFRGYSIRLGGCHLSCAMFFARVSELAVKLVRIRGGWGEICRGVWTHPIGQQALALAWERRCFGCYAALTVPCRDATPTDCVM